MLSLQLALWITLLSLANAREPRSKCGGLLTDTAGWFYPSSWTWGTGRIAETESTACLWIIRNTEGKMIKIQIHDMNTQSDPYCRGDHIEVEDDNRLLGHYCGNGKVPPLFTKTDHMYVLAIFDPEGVEFSVNVSYHLVDIPKKQCGGTLNGTSGWLTSLDSQNSGLYDTSLECIWSIQAERDYVIVLQFVRFDIRGYMQCSEGDFIEIKDGYSALKRLCGSSLPPVLTSESNLVRLRFLTDSEDSGEGFNITYYQVQASSIECGGMLTEDFGIIDSADSVHRTTFDTTYLDRHECLWIINADEEKVIEFQILEINIEDASGCHDNSLVVYEHIGVVGQYCGSTAPQPLTSTSSALFVTLYVTSDAKTAVFKASYTQVYTFNQECGGRISKTSGRITSPDLTIDSAVECFWVIEADQGMEIEFRVRVLEIADSYPCKNYLQIYDKTSQRQKICGAVPEKNPIRSLSNVLYVRFHVRDSSSRFIGKYTQVTALSKDCGGILNDTAGRIMFTDKDFDRQYDHNLDCLWVIKVREPSVIFLQFSLFRLEYSENCRYDYLEIYEEDDEIQRLCSTYHNPAALNVLSKTGELYIHFVTDGSRNDDGFLALYEQKEDIRSHCDRELNATSGRLLPYNAFEHIEMSEWRWDCFYVVTLEEGQLVHFDPFLVKTRQSTSCGVNFVQIEGTVKLCGKMSLPDFRSKTNTLRMHFSFTATINDEHDGFNISYHQVKDPKPVCGKTLTDKSGWIAFQQKDLIAPNINLHMAYNLDCLWTISVPENLVIELQVVEIQALLEYRPWIDSNQNGDHLQISEGHHVLALYNILMEEEDVNFVTEQNKAYIQYITDGWSTQEFVHGFGIIYTAIEDDDVPCSSSYRCLSSDLSIPRDSQCDGKRNCLYGDDERFCDSIRLCPHFCKCKGLSIDCGGKRTCGYPVFDESVYSPPVNNTLLSEFTTELDVSNNPEAYHKLQLERQTLRFLRIMNISFCEVSSITARMFERSGMLKILDISHNAIQRLPGRVFKYQEQLTDLILKGNTEILYIESECFFGLSALDHLELSHLHLGFIAKHAFIDLKLRSLEISFSFVDEVENNAFEHLQTRYLFLNTSKISTYSSGIFEGISSLRLLVTDSYKFCCVRPFDLPTNSCWPIKPDYLSCEDLLGGERYVLWITGLCSIFTNLVSTKHHFSDDEEISRFGYTIYLLNLGLSDCLAGIYVVIVVIADASMRGNYAFSEDIWRSGDWCLVGRLFSSLSIIATSLFVCLLALARLLVIKFPSGKFRFRKTWSRSFTLISWCVAVFSSILPLVYTDGEVCSTNRLCLGLPFGAASAPSWFPAISVLIIVSACTVVLVCLGFWLRYKESKDTKAKLIRPRLQRAEDLSVTRNILILLTVDAMCLITIVILVGVGWSGSEEGLYAWTIVMMLSLISVMHPFMYNLSAIFDITAFSPSKDEQDRPEIRAKAELDQILSLMTTRCYWKRGTRMQGFLSLPKLLKLNQLSYKDCALIARGLVRRIAGLHSRGLTQVNLRKGHVFVKGNPSRKVALICRPQLMNRPIDQAANIENFGNVLSVVIKKYDEIHSLGGPADTPKTSTSQ